MAEEESVTSQSREEIDEVITNPQEDINPEEISSPVPKRPRFAIDSFTITKYTSRSKIHYIGKFSFGTTHSCGIVNWKKCEIRINDQDAHLNFDNDLDAVVHITWDISLTRIIFASRIFDFDIIFDESNVSLCLYIRKLPLRNLSVKNRSMLHILVNRKFNINLPRIYNDITHLHYEEPQEIYKKIAAYRPPMPEVLIDVQHPLLMPELREYQVDAVQWMLYKEKTRQEITSAGNPMFVKLFLPEERTLYYNRYSGDLQEDYPSVTFSECGAILADEMGLGKTVEVLACILNNCRPRANLSKAPKHSGRAGQNDSTPRIIIQRKRVLSQKRAPVKRLQPTNTVEVKGVSKVSAARLAAQIWYESKLAEVTGKGKAAPPKQEPQKVECICGEFHDKSKVACIECGKEQHRTCMRYRGPDHEYICPQCWVNKPLLKSKATLIVAPAAISRQWSLEIINHIKGYGLTVLEYAGIHQGGMIYPPDLLKYDIVITNYNVLQSELKFTNDNTERKSLRHAKRYYVPVTPLVRIDWWRLCLDEAQAVECTASNVMSMTKQLTAVHRWAVTGTPIQKSIKDLYGLVQYLGLSPYDNEQIWRRLLYSPYVHGNEEPMLRFLAKIMWRTSKTDVLDQIQIPPQTVETHILEFSPVEKYSYKREHSCSVFNFVQNLKRFPSLDIVVKTLSKSSLKRLLAPLSALRKTCAHSFSIKGNFLATKRQVNSMEELLEVMMKKNVTESEEHLRTVIASLNGAAGVLLLQHHIIDAVRKYLEAISYIRKYERQSNLKVDKLQRIHALHNLYEILQKYYIDIPELEHMTEEHLLLERNDQKRRYMKRFINYVIMARRDVDAAAEAVKKTKTRNSKEPLAWCFVILDWAVINYFETDLMDKVKYVTHANLKAKYLDINTIENLKCALATWQKKVTDTSEIVYQELDDFHEMTTLTPDRCFEESVVSGAMECHLRPSKSKRTKKACVICALDIKLKKYECIIFEMKLNLEKLKQSHVGTWHPCTEERMLKTIYNFYKQKATTDADLVQDAEKFFTMCELRRKEFKELRKLYITYDQQISAQDEINICTIRYRLSVPTEAPVVIKEKKGPLVNLGYDTVNKHEFINVLTEEELEGQYLKLRHDKACHAHILHQLLGTQRYLETLKKQKTTGATPDPCPVCRLQLTENWAVFHCGHSYCLDCLHTLLQRSNLGTYVLCCICRKKQSFKDISYVKAKSSNEVPDVEINGSFPTKIHAVIKLTLKLRQEDPFVKILIFSAWDDVLKLLSEAFALNRIGHELIQHAKMQTKLENFKAPNGRITALLLPTRLGARGLNLIEATHIFLVEPLLNPDEELQAVGRNHRIGQTKQTTVHRFLIKNTIEESILNATSANATQWGQQDITLRHLKELFTLKETNEAGNSAEAAL